MEKIAAERRATVRPRPACSSASRRAARGVRRARASGAPFRVFLASTGRRLGENAAERRATVRLHVKRGTRGPAAATHGQAALHSKFSSGALFRRFRATIGRGSSKWPGARRATTHAGRRRRRDSSGALFRRLLATMGRRALSRRAAAARTDDTIPNTIIIV